MKILILSNTNNIKNGCGNITHELCSRLRGKSLDILLLLPRTHKKYDYASYPIKYILPERISSFRTRQIFNYLKLPHLDNIESYDIIHSLFAFPYSVLAARIAKKYKKKLVIGAQGTYGVEPLLHWPKNIFLKRSYNQAKIIIVPSKFTAQKVKQFSKTKTPIRVIHNGVNFERFQKKVDLSKLREKYRDKKILLTVGGLKRRKGQDIVIKSLAVIKKRYKNFHYLIVGSGSQEDLKKLVGELGLESFVTFLGEVSDNDIVKLFRFCDIYIQTPRLIDWNFEGFGIVYLEASACKKPVIAARSGGIEDAVLDSKTGLIVPEEDIEATSTALLKLLENPELCRRLGEAGFRYAAENDWDIITNKFIEVYEGL